MDPLEHATAAVAMKPMQVTEPNGQQDPSLSQKLWDDAYDEIEKDDNKLVASYKRILAKILAEQYLAAGATKNAKVEVKRVEKEIRARLEESEDRVGAGTAVTETGNALTEHEALTTKILDELGDRTQRQSHLKTLVENGKAKFERSAKITRAVGSFAETLLSTKPLVDLVLQSTPQAAPAALPWAGVCFGLEVGDAWLCPAICDC